MNNIRSIRKSKYLTLQQISDKTGLSVSTISAIERGISNPTLSTLDKLSEALNTEIKELLNR